MFKKAMDFGQAGDNVGVLLRGLKREDVRRGQVIAAPGTIKTYKKFKVSAMSTSHKLSLLALFYRRKSTFSLKMKAEGTLLSLTITSNTSFSLLINLRANLAF